jgi:hypothetical protein
MIFTPEVKNKDERGVQVALYFLTALPSLGIGFLLSTLFWS